MISRNDVIHEITDLSLIFRKVTSYSHIEGNNAQKHASAKVVRYMHRGKH